MTASVREVPHSIPASPRAVPSYDGQCGVTRIQKTFRRGRGSLLNSRYHYGRSCSPDSGIPGAEASRMLGLNASMAPRLSLPLLGNRRRRHEPPGPPDAGAAGTRSRAPTDRSTPARTATSPTASAASESSFAPTTASAVDRRHRPVRLLDRRGADTPELRAATRLGLELVPRPALLAEVVNGGEPGWPSPAPAARARSPGCWRGCSARAGVTATVLGGAALAGEGTNGCFTAGPADGPRGRGGVRVGRHAGRVLADHRPRPQHQPRPRRAARRCACSSPPSGPTASGCSSTPGAPRPPTLGRRYKAFSYGLAPDADAGSRSRAWAPTAHGDSCAVGRRALPRRAAARPPQPRERRRGRRRGHRAGARSHDRLRDARPLPRRGAPLRGGGDHAVGHPRGGRLRPQRREATGDADHRAGGGPDGWWRCSSRTASGPRASCVPS